MKQGMQTKKGIFGKVLAWGDAAEEQGRKTLHSHMMLFIEHFDRLVTMLWSEDPETRKAEFDKYETSITNIHYEEVPIYDERDYEGIRFVERGIGILADNPGVIITNTTDNINTNIANVVPEWLRTIT